MPEKIDEILFRLTNFQQCIDPMSGFDAAARKAQNLLKDHPTNDVIDYVIDKMEQLRVREGLPDWLEKDGDALVKLMHSRSKDIAEQAQKTLSNTLDMVSIRLIEDKPLLSNYAISCPEDAVELIGRHIRQMDREVLALVNVDAMNHPINASIVSMGVATSTFLSTQNVLKAALLSNASAIFILHNHPSGSLMPSAEDIEATEKIRKAAEFMEISVHDHIIVGARSDQYFSFFEHGLFNNDVEHTAKRSTKRVR